MECGKHVQFEEGEIGVAVVCLRLALLHHVVLEDGRGLGVVAVEAIEDLVDVLGPLGREVKGGAHGVDDATGEGAVVVRLCRICVRD